MDNIFPLHSRERSTAQMILCKLSRATWNESPGQIDIGYVFLSVIWLCLSPKVFVHVLNGHTWQAWEGQNTMNGIVWTHPKSAASCWVQPLYGFKRKWRCVGEGVSDWCTPPWKLTGDLTLQEVAAGRERTHVQSNTGKCWGWWHGNQVSCQD